MGYHHFLTYNPARSGSIEQALEAEPGLPWNPLAFETDPAKIRAAGMDDHDGTGGGSMLGTKM